MHFFTLHRCGICTKIDPYSEAFGVFNTGMDVAANRVTPGPYQRTKEREQKAAIWKNYLDKEKLCPF